MRYELSGLAEAQLENLYLYGAEAFGIEQAERYQESLFRVFDLLAYMPEMGIAKDDPAERRFPHGRHVLIYRIHSTHITIRAVVHSSTIR